MAERRQIAIDCGQSLLTKSVETGRQVSGNRWTCIRCHGGVP